MKICMVTSAWPSPDQPAFAPFSVNEVEQLRKEGCSVDVFHFRGGFNPFRYIKAWYKFHTELNKHDWDIVHAQFGQNGLIALFPRRRPLVVTFPWQRFKWSVFR